MIEDKARELMQQRTLDIKTRQGALLKKTAEDCNLQVDAENITKNQGKLQPTFRKDYR